MKYFIFGIITIYLINLKAQAIEVYNCDFQVRSWTKKTFLLKNITNKQSFHKTELALSVNSAGKLTGTVNGQPNFILLGTPESGSFQSAYDQGTIKCAPKTEVDYLLRFNPWGQFFSLNPKLSQGHIQNSVRFAQIRYGYLCFIGDIQSTARAIYENSGLIGTIKDAYTLNYTEQVTDCINGYGHRDDWTCTKYETKSITKSIPHCFETVNDRT